MGVEIRVPSLGESVAEATVAKWFKQVGDRVTEDEPIVELETDKVTLEFNAPASGTLAEILVEERGDSEGGLNARAVPAERWVNRAGGGEARRADSVRSPARARPGAAGSRPAR